MTAHLFVGFVIGVCAGEFVRCLLTVFRESRNDRRRRM